MRHFTLSTGFRIAVGALLAAVFAFDTLAEDTQPADHMQWWREARFGLFVHWGPVSIKGTEIGWSRGGERRGTGGTGSIPVDVYDNLYKEFNPVEFHAAEWVEIAKLAGMRYIVFTSKHHDGFSNFDSALTDYKITNAPFGRDIVRELVDACHEAAMPIGFYYSPPDWHHPDYRTENHARYVEYLHGQIRELCTNYGKIAILWFDGLGGTKEDWDAENLLKMVRELQPGIVINNRAGLPADHDTPEQRVGKFQIDRAWETCMTICRQWAWKPDDEMKSLKECLDVLAYCAGGDGNLLFNVGPMPTGQIETRQISRLAEMGAWLKLFGESIHGTRGGPFMPGTWGASTRRGNTVYLHVLKWEAPVLSLPPVPAKIVGSTVLTGGEAEIHQSDSGIRVSVPTAARQELDTIIALELDTDAAGIEAVAVPSGSLAFGKQVRASNIYMNNPAHTPDKACDDDDGTRWATDSGTDKAWLEVDLGKPVAVGCVVIKEAYGRVRRFAIEYRDGTDWRTALDGKTIGECLDTEFDPVTAQVFRLNIKEATEGPTIYEFQLLPPGE